MRPADMSPEAWNDFLDVVRKMTPAERLQRVFEVSAEERKRVEADIRQAHPDASEREIFLRAAHHRLGPELYAKVFGAELPL